jgi:hypothetical protein
MAIDWKGMPHGMLVEELTRALDERDARVKALSALGAPRAGRPRKNGFEAPEGDLDREAAGDA